MIEIFQAATTAQTKRHFSTKRTIIPTLELQTASDGDFCTCRYQPVPALKFFTDEVGDDDLKNDFFTLFQNSITGGSHKVFYSTDGWETETEITNNDFGTFYAGSVWCGYNFTAYKIFLQLGYCKFSACIRNYSTGGTVLVQEIYSVDRKLQKFSDIAANKTVVIETRKNGQLRHGADYSTLTLSGGSPKPLAFWPQQIRLNGSLKLADMPTELDRLMLNDNIQSSLQVMDTASFEYDLTVTLHSSDQIMPVLLDDFFANVVYVTDYNVLNFDKNSNDRYVKLRLIRQSVGIAPSSNRIRKSFNIKMRRELSNIEKFND